MLGSDRTVTKDHREVEIKLRVEEDLARVRRRLESAGFKISKARVFESNILFDTAERKLRESSQLLRLRRVGDECILIRYSNDAGQHLEGDSQHGYRDHSWKQQASRSKD